MGKPTPIHLSTSLKATDSATLRKPSPALQSETLEHLRDRHPDFC